MKFKTRPMKTITKAIALILGFIVGTMPMNAGDSRLYNEDLGKRMNEQIKQNNVQSITGYTFSYVNGVLGKESYKSSVEMFDKSGNKTEDAVYAANGESEFSFIYSYNEEGIQLKNVGIRLHKPVYNFWSYEIIDSLSALKRYHTDTRNTEYWMSYFDKNGRKVKEEYYGKDGFLDHSKVFAYDNTTGRLTEKSQLDGYGNVYSRSVYTYDEKGNNTSVIQYDAMGKMFQTNLLSYDEKGNVKTSAIQDHSNTLITMTVYSYAFN